MPHSFLVIDDSKLHHQMYRVIFSRGELAGSTVHFATNGREGYGLLAAHPELTLVLLDLNMPEMNGLEVLERRRAEGLHPHVPDRPRDHRRHARTTRRAAARAGAWEYLRKPFQPADIERLVDRALAAAAAAA